MEVWGWFEDNKGTFEEIGSAIADTVVPAVSDLWDVLSDIFDKEDVLNGIVTLLGVGLVAAAVVVTGVLTSLAVAVAVVGTAITVLGWIVGNVVQPFVRAWDDIYRWTKQKWGEITSWVSDKVESIGAKFQEFKNTASRIWNAIGQAIRNPVETAINALTRLWNNFTGSLKLPSLPSLSGVTRGLKIPGLATGGIVPATPGGRIVRISEGGEDEAVVPLSKLSSMAGSGGSTTIRIESGGSDLDRVLVDLIRRSIRTRGGNVQAVLGG
jgi:hypothetical protein